MRSTSRYESASRCRTRVSRARLALSLALSRARLALCWALSRASLALCRAVQTATALVGDHRQDGRDHGHKRDTIHGAEYPNVGVTGVGGVEERAARHTAPMDRDAMIRLLCEIMRGTG